MLCAFRAQAAGDDHPAILGHGLADRIQALGLGTVEKPASIDQHHVGPVIARRDLVALGAEPGEDALGIDQRLGAAEADDPDLGSGLGGTVQGLHGGAIKDSATAP